MSVRRRRIPPPPPPGFGYENDSKLTGKRKENKKNSSLESQEKQYEEDKEKLSRRFALLHKHNIVQNESGSQVSSKGFASYEEEYEHLYGSKRGKTKERNTEKTSEECSSIDSDIRFSRNKNNGRHERGPSPKKYENFRVTIPNESEGTPSLSESEDEGIKNRHRPLRDRLGQRSESHVNRRQKTSTTEETKTNSFRRNHHSLYKRKESRFCKASELQALPLESRISKQRDSRKNHISNLTKRSRKRSPERVLESQNPRIKKRLTTSFLLDSKHSVKDKTLNLSKEQDKSSLESKGQTLKGLHYEIEMNTKLKKNKKKTRRSSSSSSSSSLSSRTESPTGSSRSCSSSSKSSSSSNLKSKYFNIQTQTKTHSNKKSGYKSENETRDENKTSGKSLREDGTHKYCEPPSSRKPKIKWRLYVFKGVEELPVLYIHRQSYYLLGRDRKVADVPLDHPSCSKTHAVLQYLSLDFERQDGSQGTKVIPHIFDLLSANGTFINNKRIESETYVQVFEKDVLKFGFSSREYVLLHDQSSGNDEDEGMD